MVENFIDKINNPNDVKKLPLEKLAYLAEEIRQKIIEVVYKHGGHLGSNLGVIELTLALHYVFDPVQDRLIWDVSHQSYTHKVLTGRKKALETLRELEGLSGFASSEESECDPFIAGHAGTAISTALGLACGDSLTGKKRKIVAIVGDGAMTCGMSFEALNHCGALQKNILVILNDNKMSISRTIGAMANYLNKLRMGGLYKDIKKEIYDLLDRIPVVGHHMEKALDHLRASAIAPLGGFIFEELGFTYYGPLDGHNIPLMVHTLKEIQRDTKPIILHLLTEKGRGSEQALKDPFRFHGIGPLKMSTDEIPPISEAKAEVAKHTYTDVFSQTIRRLARENPRVITITAAMPDGTGLVGFEKEFPGRYFDVGICEQHGVGLATGLAASGLKPVVAIYSTFLQRAFDQLFHEIALQGSNVLVTMDRAGLVGADGPTHHGVFDISYTRPFPGFVLMAPKDGAELEQMLEFGLKHTGPVFIRYPRTNIPDGTEEIPVSEPIREGRAEVLKQGPDGTILAYGSMVYPALAAARILEQEGIKLTVVNARFAKPLDKTLIAKLIQEQPFIITVEENILSGGFGSAVLEFASSDKATRLIGGSPERRLNRPIIRLGIPDRFIQHGPREKLLASLGLDTAGIVRMVRQNIEVSRLR